MIPNSSLDLVVANHHLEHTSSALSRAAASP
jgi:hypothetical protein